MRFPIGADATIPRAGRFDATAAWDELACYRYPDVGAAALHHAGLDPRPSPT